MLFVCHDLSDRQQAKERERQARDQLRALSSRLFAIQEEERRRLEPDTLVLTVQDNGRGVDPARLAAPHAFGVVGMRERLLAWGGALCIAGTPGHGTRVTARLPLATAHQEHGPVPPLGPPPPKRHGTGGGTSP